MRLGIVLFNLGGPDSLDAVQPFLTNLFRDRAIIRAPALIRYPLAALIARRRRDYARSIYASIGGGSPIVRETEAQAAALDAALKAEGVESRTVIAMRYWHPRAGEAARALAAWKPDRIALLPLYPQFSTTTTASSLADWQAAARRAGLAVPSAAMCCYPLEPGFIAAYGDLLGSTMRSHPEASKGRILFSAHGLPERIVAAGDPYPKQVEASARAIIEAAGLAGTDWRVTYQSRVGPLKWIGPDTDSEIEAVSREKRVPIVVPHSFVSEHSETLYELDQVYRDMALKAGAPAYLRVPAVGTHPAFIAGLARMARAALAREGIAPGSSWNDCGSAGCPCKARHAA